MKDTKLKVHVAVSAALFAAAVLWLIFVAPMLCSVYGIYASIISELFFLLAAVTAVVAERVPIKAVFKTERICVRQIAGVIVLYFGSTYLVTGVAQFTSILFPGGMQETMQYMLEQIGSLPFWLSMTAVAVIPAVCEEALFRGTILNSLSSIRSRGVLIAVMGVLFGIIHLDVYRFLITGILGAVLTYIMLETENIFMPMLFHFINNSASVFSARYLSAMPDAGGFASAAGTEIISKLSTASAAVYAAAAPFVIFGGILLIRRSRSRTQETKRKNKCLLICAACVSALFISAGTIYMVLG